MIINTITTHDELLADGKLFFKMTEVAE